MVINWFPGHMTKALRTMSAEIKNIDCVIYALDARAPFACLNPEFDKLVKNKKVLVAINKIDLCDFDKLNTVLPRLKDYFKDFNVDFVLLNSTLSGSGKKIFEKIETLCKVKIERFDKKGIIAPIKAMVIGVPNCGKSTLVNNLCGRAKTITGDKAGVTRGKQWVKVSNTTQLLDTPGTLYPNLKNEKSARFLAYIGSIKNEVLEFNELALAFIKDIMKQYPNALKERYAINYANFEDNTILSNEDALAVIDNIAKARHLIKKGSEVDYDRACFTIIDDFRKSRLGKITLL